MELDERLSELKESHDWRGFARALEERIGATESARERADMHLQLGRLLRQKLLDGKRALPHLQSAIELDPTAVEALSEARDMHWELGQLENVKELLELELELTPDASAKQSIHLELGGVLTDLGAVEAAADAYSAALRDSDGQLSRASELLQDTAASEEDWQERIGFLLRSAHEAETGGERSGAFLRAARLANRFAPDEAPGILRQAFEADPSNVAAGALYQASLRAKDGETVAEEQRELIEGIADPAERARAAFVLGERLAVNQEHPVQGIEFIETALRGDPSNEPAFNYICDSYSAQGDWDRALQLADELTEAHPGSETEHILIRAGQVAWQDKEDIDRAGRYFERLRESSPSHPAIATFERATSMPPANGVDVHAEGDVSAEVPDGSAEVLREEVAEADPSDAFQEDPELVASLTEKLDKQKKAKRYHEYVKTLVALAEAVGDVDRRLELLLEAAELYASKFVNHAEAMRTYEKVLAADPRHEHAMGQLREMYTKRRDWDKLIDLMRSEADQKSGSARAGAMKEIAELALARIKNKPELCISLWNEVLAEDASDPDALGALAELFERARRFDELADALEKLAETAAGPERVRVLLKLGQVTGDRLKDDARAVEAYRELVELAPGERRYQEQLKKRYIALGRWDDLEEFYKSSGNWDEFIRVLESQEARSKDPAQRAAMLLKVGELWTTQKGRPERAVRAYEKVLTLDPQHRDVAERLIPIYEAGKNAKGLAGVLEIKLSHVEGDGDKLSLLRQLGELYETRLRDQATAFRHYRAAFAAVPGDAQAQADLERMAAVVQDWPAVVAAYEESIAALEECQDLVAATSLKLALARTLVEHGGERDRGVEVYRSVMTAEPENDVAFFALEELYAAAEGWAPLLEICELRRSAISDPEAEIDLLVRIAGIHEEKLSDLAAAKENFELVLVQRPEDAGTLSALERLYLATEDWSAYAGVLVKQVELLPAEAELVELKVRLAATQLEKLDDAAGALDTFREVLLLDQENAVARTALEGFLKHETLAADAAAVLEPIYEARGAWEQLISVLEVLVAHQGDDDLKVSLLQRIATTSAGILGDRTGAFDAYARALKIAPEREEIRLELLQIAENDERLPQLVSVYSDIAGEASAATAREYRLSVAAVHERLGAIDEAAEAYRAVLEEDATDGVALGGLDSLFRASERWEDLAGTLRRKLALTTVEAEREGLFAEIASVYEHQLGEPKKAIAVFGEALEAEPSNLSLLGALEGLLAREKQWEALSDNIEAQLSLASDPEVQTGLRLRLATLQEQELGAPERAIDGFREVLDRVPTHAEALEAMERLGQHPDYELQIAGILEPLYRNQGDAEKLVRVLETQARLADGGDAAVELLAQVADLQEEAIGDLGAAFDVLSRTLSIAPDHEATRERLSQLARATGRFDDFATLLARIGGETDEPLGTHLLMAAANLVEVELGDLPRAVALYRTVYELDAENLGAVDALESGYRSLGEAEALAQILVRKSELLSDADQRRSALFQAAELLEGQLAQPERAVEAYKKVLDIDPDDSQGLSSLARLYSVLGEWRELIQVYERQAEVTLDAPERRTLLLQIGRVLETQLEAPEEAVETYQRVLDLEPDDLDSLAQLDALYAQLGKWDELLSVLGRQAELADDVTSVAFRFRVAELHQTKLGDIARAVELYRDLLAEVPEYLDAQAALEGIMRGDEESLAAASVLAPVYEQNCNWEGLTGVLRVEAAMSSDTFSKVETLHRIGQLEEDRLLEPARAFQTLSEALALDSQNEDTLTSIERLAMALERWSDVTALYDQALEGLGEDPARFVELALRTAQLYEVQLDNTPAAIERYQRALSVDPENPSALSALDRLYTQTEAWAELTGVLNLSADLGSTPDEILELKFRLGQTFQHRLHQLDEALVAYRDILAAAPEHAGARGALEGLFQEGEKSAEIAEVLEPLYQAAGEWESLVLVHEARLEGTQDPSERLPLFHRIAEDLEDRLLDTARAMTTLTRALLEHPLDERTGDELERLASLADNGWERLANAYADVLETDALEIADRASLGKRLARVFEEELSDLDKAQGAYSYVLSVVPTDAEALVELDRIYSGAENFAALAEVLEKRIQDEDALNHDRAELCLRLGGIYEGALERHADAVRVYRMVIERFDTGSEDAIAALERIYALREEWSELEGLFNHELENAVGDAQQADVLAKRARLSSERLGKTEQAVQGWQQVLELRGEDPEALGAMAVLYEAQELWPELTEILERQFDVAETDEERVQVLATRARLFHEVLDRQDDALDTWERVLDIDPEYLPGLRAMVGMWRDRGDARALADALLALIERAAPILDATEMVAAYRELAENYSGKLDQPYDAADAWKQLLEIAPADLPALDALEAIYESLEQWKEVAGIKLSRGEAVSDPEEKINQWLAAAALWETPIGEPDGATAPNEKVLEIDADHAGAFKALERLHTTAGRWAALTELYLSKLDRTDDEDTATRVSLLRRIGCALESDGDLEQAYEALTSAFGEDFSDKQTIEDLERVTAKSDRWGELVNTTHGWLAEQTEREPQLELCLRLAKWYADDLGRQDHATPYYERIAELDPNNTQVLRQVAAISRKAAEWEKARGFLTQALNVAATNEERVEIQCDLGELLEKHMNEGDKGIACYERAREISPTSLRAIEALEGAYESRKRYSDLTEILTAKVDTLEEDDAISVERLRLGQLYETQLNNLEAAAENYESAIELGLSSLNVFSGFERCCRSLGRWKDLAKTLERELDVVETQRERLEVLLQLAQLLEEEFLEPVQAAERYEAALEIDAAREAAYEGLARCYRRTKAWAELVRTYERHIEEAGTRETKVQLYAQLAEVLDGGLNEPDRAIDAYRSALDIDDTEVSVLEALGKLYEKQGEGSSAIEMMGRVADLTTDGTRRVEMLYRVGRAQDEQLGDRVAARERYEMAADLDPTHLPSLRALKAISLDEADWDAAIRYVEAEQEYTDSARARARLLVEQGEIFTDKLDDLSSALDAYRRAVELDEDCSEAALPLLRDRMAKEDFAAAEPLARMLARRGRGGPKQEQRDIHLALGQVLLALGNNAEALEAYQRAHELDLTDLRAVRGVAEAAFQSEDWPAALTSYQKVLTSLEEGDSAGRTEVYHQLALVKQAQGQTTQAIHYFEKALSIDDEHRPTLDALVELYCQAGDWKEVASHKRLILDGVIEGDDRYEILVEIGDIWATKEDNAAKAIDAYEEALELCPDDRALLHKLLELYKDTAEWTKMAETLEAIASLVKNRAPVFNMLGQLHRDEDKLNDPARAVEYFNQTLDLRPDMLEVFERVDKILTKQKDWRSLERNYRKMIKRARAYSEPKPDVEYMLWHQLGVIYRDRIGDSDSALEAFRESSKVQPASTKDRQILSELYEAAGRYEEAAAQQLVLLAAEPTNPDIYHALFRIRLSDDDLDGAWRTAAALDLLKRSSPDEQAFLEARPVPSMLQVQRRLPPDAWTGMVTHGDLSPQVSAVFRALAPAALRAQIELMKRQGKAPVLDPRAKQDPQTSTITFAKTFGWVGQVLGVRTPELYVRKDVSFSVMAAPAEPVASVAGNRVLSGLSHAELRFICGEHLADFSEDTFVRLFYKSREELQLLFLAGAHLVNPSQGLPTDAAESIQATARTLAKHLQPGEMEALRTAVRKFNDAGGKANLKKWVRAASLSASRAGLLVCGDLGAAVQVVRSTRARSGEPTAEEKMLELIIFSVGEEYGRLRDALGIAVTA